MEPLKTIKLIKLLNAIDALGLGFLLIIAFVLQIALYEPPCPLCILQRVGILGMAFGFLLNVRFKVCQNHYSLSLLAAILTGAISLRQILLHVMPGDQGYGYPLLGLHLYTWVLILCVVIIIYIAIIFGISLQYSQVPIPSRSKSIRIVAHTAFAVVFLLTILNGISTYLECGLNSCPENPVNYKIQLLKPY